jgi:hypothetical protein
MLLTLDRGIGDLRRYPPDSHAGILVFLRPVARDPGSILALSSASREPTCSTNSAVASPSSSRSG